MKVSLIYFLFTLRFVALVAAASAAAAEASSSSVLHEEEETNPNNHRYDEIANATLAAAMALRGGRKRHYQEGPQDNIDDGNESVSLLSLPIPSGVSQAAIAAVTKYKENGEDAATLSLQERADVVSFLHSQFNELYQQYLNIDVSEAPQFKEVYHAGVEQLKAAEKPMLDTIHFLKSAAEASVNDASAKQAEEGTRQDMHDGAKKRKLASVSEPKEESYEYDEDDFDTSWSTFSSSRRPGHAAWKHDKRRRISGDSSTRSFPNFGQSGFTNGGFHSFERLQRAIQNGDENALNKYISDLHRKVELHGSHDATRRYGRRVFETSGDDGNEFVTYDRNGRRLTTRNEKCELLATCASGMSLYDLFVWFYSDDIDAASGRVDDNVFHYDEGDIKEKQTRIKNMARNILDIGSYEMCGSLLREFHRTIEFDNLPKWEGATISQVCLAEGTQIYVETLSAVRALFQIPNEDRVFKEITDAITKGRVFHQVAPILCGGSSDSCEGSDHFGEAADSGPGELVGIRCCQLSLGRVTAVIDLDGCAEGVFTWQQAVDKCIQSRTIMCSEADLLRYRNGDLTIDNNICGFDNRFTWTRNRQDGLSASTNSFATQVFKQYVHLVETFLVELFECARDLFNSADRTSNPEYAQESFVFQSDGSHEPINLLPFQSSRLLDFAVPNGKYVDNQSDRGIDGHGALRNNNGPLFETIDFGYLLNDLHSCFLEERAMHMSGRYFNFMTSLVGQNSPDDVAEQFDFEVDDNLRSVLGDEEFAKRVYYEARDSFLEGFADHCLRDFLGVIESGLGLVLGQGTSVGKICGIKEAVVNKGKSLPGFCCLDAPWQMSGDNFGSRFDCSRNTCQNFAPYFGGLSEEACDVYGGTFCPNPTDCSTLQTCVSEMIELAETEERFAFAMYLSAAPNITDPMDYDQCGEAREYFGFDPGFINDVQICEDVAQLRFTQDFAFLEEFTGQGTDMAAEAPVDEPVPEIMKTVPPLELVEPDRTVSSSAPFQNGQAWEIANFVIEGKVIKFETLVDATGSIFCFLDGKFAVVYNICEAIRSFISLLQKKLLAVKKKILSISEFTFAQLANVGNIEPRQTFEETLVLFENMQLTGNYMQERFEDLGDILADYFEDVVPVLLDNRHNDVIFLFQTLFNHFQIEFPSLNRKLLEANENSLEQTNSAGRGPAVDNNGCNNNLSIQIRTEIIHSEDDPSMRAFLCFVHDQDGAPVTPKVVELATIDFSAETQVPIESFKIVEFDVGILMVKLSKDVKLGSNTVFVRVGLDYKNSDNDNEEDLTKVLIGKHNDIVVFPKEEPGLKGVNPGTGATAAAGGAIMN